ncbi:methyltransferase [Oscillibacter valericigenes Sjm18-20]|nr:methyltransferase [Oscillibacter valericigenes Sjm18-20]
MQFFSLFDLLSYTAKEKDITVEEMFSFFHSKKIKKASILELQQTSYIPDDVVFREAICEFLDMNDLEINIAMGHIPQKFRKSYFDNVKKIASILSSEVQTSDFNLPCFFETDLGRLYNGDCLDVMRSLPKECVDLIFADPPFNLGKTYDPGINDNASMSQYLSWTFEWLDECTRILKPGGQIYIYNLPKWCIYIASHLQETLTFWDWIAVDMKYSLPIQSRLYPAHYALVSFVKGTRAHTFNNQRIPLQTCRHCGGEIKDYGGYKAKMNPLGVNVSDVWTDIYPVRHKSSKNRKYNELSVKLLNRIISMSSNEGDTIFDPFGGSGTTYAVAQLLNRKWIGCELGDCEIIRNRLQHLSRDKEQLNKAQEEAKYLFPPKVEELRKQNGFWICSDFSKTSEDFENERMVLNINANSNK